MARNPRRAALLFACGSLLFVVYTAVVISVFGLGEPEEEAAFADYRGRQLLRVFPSRGSQGLPYVPVPGKPTQTDVYSYLWPLIIVAIIGVAIGVTVCLVSCIVWWCRCCCGNCCKGDPDPERNFLLLRLIIALLSLCVMVGAFIGLFGGKKVTDDIRFVINSFVDVLVRMATRLQILNNDFPGLNISTSVIAAVNSTVGGMLDTVRQVQTAITPLDVVRLSLLYYAMALGMLAAISLGVGAMLRRKEVLQTGFLTCCIAIIVAWLSFAVNYPLAVIADDGCFTVNELVTSAALADGFSFVVGCISPNYTAPIDQALFASAVAVATSLRADEVSINNNGNPNNFNPLTVDPNAINATYANITAGSIVMASQYNATVTAVNAAPCSGLCNTSQFNSDLATFALVANASAVMSDVESCSWATQLFNQIATSLCDDLVTGVLLTFVGNVLVGSLLIPAGIMALYVAQKFPNRSSAAQTKSRMMVIFMFQFFHCLVLSEVNTTWVELLVAIGSMAAGLVGFLFLNIPMHKLDWPVAAQVLLACFLGVLEMACLAGWIYLFVINVQNAIACSNQAANGGLLSLLPSFISGITNTFVCYPGQYFHSLMMDMLGGVAMMITFMASLLSFVFALKTICGTPLNLQDSDYELD